MAIDTSEKAAEFYTEDFTKAASIFTEATGKEFYETLSSEFKSVLDAANNDEPWEILSNRDKTELFMLMRSRFSPDQEKMSDLIEQVFRKAKAASFNDAYEAVEAKYIKQIDDLKKENQSLKEGTGR